MPATYQRKRVQQLLKLSNRAMAQIFPESICPGGRISEEAVCRVLNDKAVAIQPVHYIPGLLTEEEFAESIPGEDGKPLTRMQLYRMCNRKRNPLPHYRLGVATRRFTPGVMEWYRSYVGSGVYVDFRRYSPGAQPYVRKDA